jgi:hypothetical protein
MIVGETPRRMVSSMNCVWFMLLTPLTNLIIEGFLERLFSSSFILKDFSIIMYKKGEKGYPFDNPQLHQIKWSALPYQNHWPCQF